MLIMTSFVAYTGVTQLELARSITCGLLALFLLVFRRWGLKLNIRADFKFDGPDA